MITPIIDDEDQISFQHILVSESNKEFIIQENCKQIPQMSFFEEKKIDALPCIESYSNPPMFDDYGEGDIEIKEHQILLFSIEGFDQQFHTISIEEVCQENFSIGILKGSGRSSQFLFVSQK